MVSQDAINIMNILSRSVKRGISRTAILRWQRVFKDRQPRESYSIECNKNSRASKISIQFAKINSSILQLQ